MRRCRTITWLTVVFMVVYLCIGMPVYAEESGADGSNLTDTGTITILHTNDTHSRVEAEGIGFGRIAALVRQYKAENAGTLVLDAGDTFHGMTIGTLVRGESIVQLMNKIGYDAMTAGNHDFNYGYERLQELDRISDFPILSANIKKADGSRLLSPYIIKELNGIKVGILGLTTPETTYKTHPKNVEGLTFVNPVDEARAITAQLKDKVDVIIALAHLGTDESSTDTSIELARQVPDIDLIIDGHSHSVLENGTLVGNTLIASAGEYDKYLGVVELTFKGKDLIDKKAGLLSKEETESIAEDRDILEAINSIKSAQNVILSEVIGKTSVRLDGERELVRSRETNLGNLITDAMIYVSKADVALTNGGGIRASIETGDITKGNIITVLPFGNYIVTKKVKGSDVKAALEHGVKDYPKLSGGFPHVSGIKYTINPSGTAGEKVSSILIGGKPLNLDREYTLATNDFMASGGDGYTMFADDSIANEFSSLDEAVISYIETQGVVSYKTEGRISERKAESGKNTAVEEADTQVYVVKAGDVLWKIAEKFNTTWQELQKLNSLKNPHLIFPGQKIAVPAN